MPRPGPSLAQVQLAADRRRLARRPELLRRKWTRMARSPFAFLRGSSVAWAALMRARPGLLRGTGGEGALVGDLHLENFGTFRATSGMVFHVNDFDETFDGPWAFDVLRLLTSVLLARAELRSSGVRVLALAEAVLEGHDAAVRGGTVPLAPAIRARLDAAMAEPADKLLKKRLDGPGRLERSADKSPPAAKALVARLPRALAQWAAGLPPAEAPPAAALELLDATRWIAGVGSLGVERLLALTRGDGTPWLLEVKEVRAAPLSRRAPDARRLVEVVRSGLPTPPRGLGAALLGRTQVIIRPLGPGEDKLEADELEPSTHEATARSLGFLAGQVHRRVATHSARWSATRRRQLVAHATALALEHEAAFLDFCVAARPHVDASA